MNITELAAQVAEAQGIDKAQARKAVDAVVHAITEAAKGGAEVALAGFGKFKVQDRPEREGRNPATGAAMTFAASRKLVFTPAKQLRDALNA